MLVKEKLQYFFTLGSMDRQVLVQSAVLIKYTGPKPGVAQKTFTKTVLITLKYKELRKTYFYLKHTPNDQKYSRKESLSSEEITLLKKDYYFGISLDLLNITQTLQRHYCT